MQQQQVYESFEDSSDLLGDMPKLRNRLKEKGYLFLRGFLDKQALLDIRRDIFGLLDKYGYIKPGTDPVDGIFRGGEFPSSLKFGTSPLYQEILELPSFNEFPRSPQLISLYEGLLLGEIQEHRRRLARITFPQSFSETTPAHQDYHYIRGTLETYTMWLSCGDCPNELGGLAVLEESHRLGFIEHVKGSGMGGFGIPAETLDATGLRWLSIDYKAGDALIFHSLTVHKAIDNRTEDRMRLSMDFRYQLKKDPINPDSMKPHLSTVVKNLEKGY